MSTTSLFWLILYGVAALLFFSVASVITYFGIQDLRDLLSKSNKKTPGGTPGANSTAANK